MQKSAPFARGEALPPLDSPVLVARAFELKRGETEPEPFAVRRAARPSSAVPEIQARELPELKEVKDQVKADLVQEKALRARPRGGGRAARARASATAWRRRRPR